MTMSPDLDPDDEIVPSSINARLEPSGKIFGGAIGEAVGEADECGEGNGNA